MSLVDELDEARRLVALCEGMPEVTKARMNFVVNVVTIVEIYSRARLKQRFDDSLLDGDFTFNTIVAVTLDDVEQRRLIREMIKIRNKFVHEGKSFPIEHDRIDRYYLLAKTILSSEHRENDEPGHKKDFETFGEESQEAAN